jgi:hypothetical protein
MCLFGIPSSSCVDFQMSPVCPKCQNEPPHLGPQVAGCNLALLAAVSYRDDCISQALHLQLLLLSLRLSVRQAQSQPGIDSVTHCQTVSGQLTIRVTVAGPQGRAPGDSDCLAQALADSPVVTKTPVITQIHWQSVADRHSCPCMHPCIIVQAWMLACLHDCMIAPFLASARHHKQWHLGWHSSSVPSSTAWQWRAQ